MKTLVFSLAIFCLFHVNLSAKDLEPNEAPTATELKSEHGPYLPFIVAATYSLYGSFVWAASFGVLDRMLDMPTPYPYRIFLALPGFLTLFGYWTYKGPPAGDSFRQRILNRTGVGMGIGAAAYVCGAVLGQIAGL